ncbi:MAG: hypothetical protein IPK13_03455 [Deltaproteobacteria bacterium]|nr:hypothetical protein [Deltaproteobacteria bacterium]
MRWGRTTCGVWASAIMLLASTGFSGCKRPVVGRNLGTSVISQLEASPSFVRAGVALEIRFTVSGTTPSNIVYSLGGQPLECDTEIMGSQYICRHPGFRIDQVPQGPTSIAVTVTDDQGRVTRGDTEVSFDFDCPTFVALSVTPDIAEPGQDAVISIQASEPLGEAPRITRAGRLWEVPTGEGARYTLRHPVTTADPANLTNIVVTITDRAGNTNNDCGVSGDLLFGVDQQPPSVNASSIHLERGEPGVPSILSATPGTFSDDTGIDTVQVFDETGDVLIGQLNVQPNGAVSATYLAQASSRVRLVAVDHVGHQSSLMLVPERWRLSVGSGATTRAGIHTAVRTQMASLGAENMTDRTLEAAPDIFASDTRALTVRADIGFTAAGKLPNAYESTFWMASGYDTKNKTIVVFGGIQETSNRTTRFDKTLLIRWDQRLGEYVSTYGPTPQEGLTPPARGGHQIAFDDRGCGLLFGGQGPSVLNDAWRICSQGSSYVWSAIEPAGEVRPAIRRTPILWDPITRRYFITGGQSNASYFNAEGSFFLREDGASGWQWDEMTDFPTSYLDRQNHVLYRDPDNGNIVVGLGRTSPSDVPQWWLFKGGHWVSQSLDTSMNRREGFGYAYDLARHLLVLWGDNTYPEPTKLEVTTLAGTSTNSLAGWTKTTLDTPLPRAWPTLVYDPDRETVVVFGGRRYDGRFVPQDIYTLSMAPSAPFVRTLIDLAAPRPEGIEAINLEIKATGHGDDDGIGPGLVAGEGIEVMLWDYRQNRWTKMATTTSNANDTVALEVTVAPERFISPEGVLPVGITTRRPSTVGVTAEVSVNLVNGYLTLRGS